MTARPYDIVLLGATGFTGGLVCAYLAAHAPPGCRWAVAGRNQRRLEALLDTAGACPPAGSVAADVEDTASLSAMASQAKVLLTTVGPYAEHGEPVVRAAVEAGADYVDISGEPVFVDRCVQRYDRPARERGVRVVNCCGFDSVPHDLGALFTAERLPHGAPMTIQAVLRARGDFSGGTWHTLIAAMAGWREQSLAGWGGDGGSQPGENSGGNGRRVRPLPPRVRWLPALGVWACPLPTIDPQIVLRTAQALDVFGPDFRYGHFAGVRRLPTLAAGAAAVGTTAALAQLAPTRAALLHLRPRGAGPTAAQRARGHFQVVFVGAAGGQRIVTSVSGGDPGYDETAKMAAESALCLALDRDRLPARTGVLTPALAMGDVLRERLAAAGLRFTVKRPPAAAR